MINIECDEMIKQLADFLNIDLKSLEISDEYEKQEIAHAHEITGLSYDEITKFFAKIEKPEFISPSWIFKALKFNDVFYSQNILLIRATDWMRQKIYAKKNQVNQHYSLQKIEERKFFDGTICKSYKISSLRRTSGKVPATAAPSNSGILNVCSECFNHPDYKISRSDWFQIPGTSKDIKQVILHIKPTNMKQFLSENHTIYVVFFTNEEKVFLVKPSDNNIRCLDSYIEVTLSINNFEIITECGISYTEDLDFFF